MLSFTKKAMWFFCVLIPVYHFVLYGLRDLLWVYGFDVLRA